MHLSPISGLHAGEAMTAPTPSAAKASAKRIRQLERKEKGEKDSKKWEALDLFAV